MSNNLIRLSKRITIANQKEADDYSIGQSYSNYFHEYNEQLSFLQVGIGGKTNVNNQNAIGRQLEGLYAAGIGQKLIANDNFVDFYGNAMPVNEIALKARSVVRGAEPATLTIYLITLPLQIICSFGATIGLENLETAQTKSWYSLDLGDDIGIYAFTPIE